MLKFEGPQLEKTPHARLIYRKVEMDKALSFIHLYETLNDIDICIKNSPRLNKANDSAYLYFFGPSAKEYWIGREITGFLSSSFKEFNYFDSFRGEVLSWNLDTQREEKLELSSFLTHSEQLRGLAGEALALTWRVKISPLELFRPENPINLPQITFQFFKTH